MLIILVILSALALCIFAVGMLVTIAMLTGCMEIELEVEEKEGDHE